MLPPEPQGGRERGPLSKPRPTDGSTPLSWLAAGRGRRSPATFLNEAIRNRPVCRRANRAVHPAKDFQMPTAVEDCDIDPHAEGVGLRLPGGNEGARLT